MKTIIVLFALFVVAVLYKIKWGKKKNPEERLRFDNMDDVKRLSGGTARFSFRDVAYEGVISEVNYVPLGPGAVNVTLLSLQPISSGNPPVPDVPLNFTFSLFMAEITSTPREFVIRNLAPSEGFGQIISLRVKA